VVSGICLPAAVVEAALPVDVDARAVELRFVVPGVAGLEVGALLEGEETRAGPTGDDVGVVDVWVGSVGDVTGVEGPVGGAEVGCCGEASVGVGVGG
jgi:hypothetical protein